MCIGFFDTTPEAEKYFRAHLRGFKLKFLGELDADNAARAGDCEIASSFVHEKIDSKILGKMGKLKLIASRSTGTDHIDFKECRRRGVRIANVPAYGENTVAEHTFALILALSRKIIESHDRVEKGDFTIEGLTGFDLSGKTLGIIGTGRIGSHVARIANGFGMRIIAFDARPNRELQKNYGVKYVPLNSLLRTADIITIHAPLLPSTRHMINSRNITLCKRNAILVNTSRGAIVDTNALVESLAAGRLGGAGLDVLEEEGLMHNEDEALKALRGKQSSRLLKTMLQDHILLRLKNVLITPHNAFNSREALERIMLTTVENIKAFAKGEPKNAVC